MTAQFDRSRLVEVLEHIGQAAVAAGAHLDIAVYGGSALMLASNFRAASEDVDIAALTKPWPDWLVGVVARIAAEHGWSPDWFNDAVEVHLSALADRAADHVEFGTFPHGAGPVGLRVFVPTATYMLALKLKAARFNDPAIGPREAQDVLHLVDVLGLASADEALAILAQYFPKTAADPRKQQFLLKHIWSTARQQHAPKYPLRGV